jgi:hypothetical protein
MVKKVFALFFSLFFCFLFFAPSKSYAISITGSYTPSTIKPGDAVTITAAFKDIPVAAIPLVIGPQRQPPGTVRAEGDSIDNFSDGHLGDGSTLTFTATYNTSEFIKQIYYYGEGSSYQLFLMANPMQPSSGPDSFTISSGTPPSGGTVPFSIDSVSPSYAKEGDMVTVKLKDATKEHNYDIFMKSLPVSSKQCPGTSCTLPDFKVPFIESPQYRSRRSRYISRPSRNR